MLIIIILLIIFVFLLFCAFVGYKLITPERLIKEWTPKDLGFDYEDVEFLTEDKIKLNGWYIPRSDKCVILLHGYSVSRWDEVYMKKMIRILAENNFSVFTFDFRAHGTSGGKHTTFGDREFMDLRSAVDWVKEKHREIYIIGYSMGGFLALKSVAEGLAEKVIADSPFIEIDKTGARGLKYFINLPAFLYPFVKIFVILFSGIKYKNTVPEKFKNDLSSPVFIIIGRNDPLVKVEEVKKFAEGKENIEIWITEGKHVRSILVNGEEYRDRVLEFLKK